MKRWRLKKCMQSGNRFSENMILPACMSITASAPCRQDKFHYSFLLLRRIEKRLWMPVRKPWSGSNPNCRFGEKKFLKTIHTNGKKTVEAAGILFKTFLTIEKQ